MSSPERRKEKEALWRRQQEANAIDRTPLQEMNSNGIGLGWCPSCNAWRRMARPRQRQEENKNDQRN